MSDADPTLVDPPEDPAPDPQPDPAPDDFDPERAMNTIRRQREAEKELRAKHAADKAALEARIKEFEDAQLSEAEKQQARIAELEAREAQWAQEKRDTALRLAVTEKAGELGITSPRLALAALRESGKAVEYDDTGQPINVGDVLTQLLEEEPALAGVTPKPKPPVVNAGDGNNNQPPPALTADELEAAAARGISPDRWAALKEGSGSNGGVTLQDWLRTQKQ